MNTFQKALLVAGALGLGSTVAAPAFAGSGPGAYVSGSSAIVLMDGASQSVGVEMSLPTGVYFPGVTAGDVVATPVLTNDLSTNTTSFTSLTVAAGAPTSTAGLAGGSGSFTAAAAAKLTAETTLDGIVSIIRAGAGINGLD